jgi:hypothetical protein
MTTPTIPLEREVMVGAVLTEERTTSTPAGAAVSRARALRVPCWALALLVAIAGRQDALGALLSLF